MNEARKKGTVLAKGRRRRIPGSNFELHSKFTDSAGEPLQKFSALNPEQQIVMVFTVNVNFAQGRTNTQMQVRRVCEEI